MKILAKIFIHALFLPVFLVALFLGTFVFHLLDKTFLFEAFESHQIYENLPKALAAALPSDPTLSEEEKAGFATILEGITPELVRNIVENNVEQMLDYMHGETADMVFTLPVVELGIVGMTEDIRWSLKEDATPDFRQQVQVLNGSIKILEKLVWGLVIVLVVLFALYAVLSRPKILRGLSQLLFPVGGITLLLALFEFIILSQLATADTLGREPAEILLFQMVGALLPGIFSFWLKLGLALFVSAVLIQIIVRVPFKKRI